MASSSDGLQPSSEVRGVLNLLDSQSESSPLSGWKFVDSAVCRSRHASSDKPLRQTTTLKVNHLKIIFPLVLLSLAPKIFSRSNDFQELTVELLNLTLRGSRSVGRSPVQDQVVGGWITRMFLVVCCMSFSGRWFRRSAWFRGQRQAQQDWEVAGLADGCGVTLTEKSLES